MGVKRQHGQTVKAGEILIRQRGAKYLAGKNVGRGSDDTLYALKGGVVSFASKKKIRFDGNQRNAKMISIKPQIIETKSE